VEDEEYGVEEEKGANGGGESTVMMDERELEEREEERYLNEHPEEKIFKELLNEVRNYQQFSDPPQTSFELANQVRLRLRPLIRLLLHEFQEFLHLPDCDNPDYIFQQVTSM
jgi:hypothetical protein